MTGNFEHLYRVTISIKESIQTAHIHIKKAYVRKARGR